MDFWLDFLVVSAIFYQQDCSYIHDLVRGLILANFNEGNSLKDVGIKLKKLSQLLLNISHPLPARPACTDDGLAKEWIKV